MKRAFAEIYAGLDACLKEIGEKERLEELKRIAAEADAAYKAGNDIKGAHILQDLQRELYR